MVLRLAVAAAFIVASSEKIIHPHTFAHIVEGYRILPAATLGLVAIWLPWTELVAGVVLIVGAWTRAVGLLLSFLTLLFIAGLVQAMARGIDIQCGCYSLKPVSDPRTWSSLWQELVLLTTCLWLWISNWEEVPEGRAIMNAGA